MRILFWRSMLWGFRAEVTLFWRSSLPCIGFPACQCGRSGDVPGAFPSFPAPVRRPFWQFCDVLRSSITVSAPWKCWNATSWTVVGNVRPACAPGTKWCPAREASHQRWEGSRNETVPRATTGSFPPVRNLPSPQAEGSDCQGGKAPTVGRLPPRSDGRFQPGGIASGGVPGGGRAEGALPPGPLRAEGITPGAPGPGAGLAARGGGGRSARTRRRNLRSRTLRRTRIASQRFNRAAWCSGGQRVQ